MPPFPLDLLAVPDLPGRLALGFAPGRQLGRRESRELDSDLLSLRRDHGLARLVCLLETHEMEGLDIPHLLERAEAAGLTPFHAPLADGGTPASFLAMEAITAPILGWLEAGDGVFIHCWAGLGRTGTVAAACLLARGCDAGEALRRVRAARPGTVETAEQEAFLHAYARWRIRPNPGDSP
jgi:protein-tyrosine phosphatase